MDQIIGYTQGTFDLFHIGHLRLLQNSRAMCDRLIVGVNSDELVEKYKHKTPVICVENRAEILRALRCVDEVVVTDTLDKMVMFERFHFNRIFIGNDWQGNERWIQTEKQLKEVGAELVFLPYTKGISSTDIRSKIHSEPENNS